MLNRVFRSIPVSALLFIAAAIAAARTDKPDMTDPRINEAIVLMDRFAQRTGLTTDHPPKRYLWTDAFAVCNYLGLARATGERRYDELALKLVDQVHHTLGRYREDESRSGWLSGLDDAEGERHPTLGGLRIAKALPERGPDDAFDARLEWERDGQYFHYLGKWMHALDQVTHATGRPRFNRWARRHRIRRFQLSAAIRPRTAPNGVENEHRPVARAGTIDG